MFGTKESEQKGIARCFIPEDGIKESCLVGATSQGTAVHQSLIVRRSAAFTGL